MSHDNMTHLYEVTLVGYEVLLHSPAQPELLGGGGVGEVHEVNLLAGHEHALHAHRAGLSRVVMTVVLVAVT